uniref:Serpentine receptor class gamma n=1 Tax=Rhabditophanes sp. KR3021 TaxID=114890 RepID=A0AC35TJH3_9BILA
MVSNFQLVQIAYAIPSTILYIAMTIFLGIKMYQKSPALSNQFFPFIMFKACVDISYQVLGWATIRLPQYNFFRNFFLTNHWFSKILYIITGVQFCLMFECVFIVALNRYIAIGYSLQYVVVFSPRNVKIMALIMLLISGCVGVGISMFTTEFRSTSDNSSVVAVYTQPGIVYYQLFYSVILYGTLMILSLIMNVTTIMRLYKRNSKTNHHYSKADYYMTIHSALSFMGSLLLESYFASRMIGYFGSMPELVNTAMICLPVISDIASFADLYSMMLTNEYVRKSMLKILFPFFKKISISTSVKLFENNVPLSKTVRNNNII